jgi:hypothetical protein
MTFKDLQRLVQSSEDSEALFLVPPLLSKLKDKPFWIWIRNNHKRMSMIHKDNCCFNHTISLPTKNGVQMPMWDYERMLYRALIEPNYLNSNSSGDVAHNFKVKHLWVKKSTGLGITEFMLRFMAWLCLRNDDYRNSQMVIVTGPNQELAIKLIKRMKGLFADKLGITFDSKETVLELNGCNIEAYPSNHIDAFRSLVNPKFILIDEGDFFRCLSSTVAALKQILLITLMLSVH